MVDPKQILAFLYSILVLISEVVMGIFVHKVFIFSLYYLFSDVEELEVADLGFPKWLNSIQAKPGCLIQLHFLNRTAFVGLQKNVKEV